MPTVTDAGVTLAGPSEAAGALIEFVGQIEYNGILLGSDTPFHWKQLTGWDSLPALDDSSSARPDAHGDFPGAIYAQSRTVTLEGWADAAAETMEQVLREFRSRLQLIQDEVPLIVSDGDGVKLAYARIIARDLAHTPLRRVGRGEYSLQWKCTDPLRYSLDQRMAALSPVTFTGGLTYPLVYPLDYGSVTGRNVTDGLNDGDAPAPAQVTFVGPMLGGYALTNTTTGQRLAYDVPLVAGETLTVDTRTGSVVLNGSSDRASYLSASSVPPELWRLQPGTNELVFTTAGGAGAGTGASVSWADTYW